MGPIKVGGNARGIVESETGLSPGSGDGFGDANDVKLSGAVVKDNDDAKAGLSKIASVIIKCTAIGSLDSNDVTTIGIEAQQLSSIKLGGAKGPLIAVG